RPRPQLDPAPQIARRKLLGDPSIQFGVQGAQRAVLRPDAPVPLEAFERTVPHLVGQRRGVRLRGGHTNLILRAATADIRSSNRPWRQRSMFVVPYVRSRYRTGISTIFRFSRAAPKIRSKSPNGSKSPKYDR